MNFKDFRRQQKTGCYGNKRENGNAPPFDWQRHMKVVLVVAQIFRGRKNVLFAGATSSQPSLVRVLFEDVLCRAIHDGMKFPLYKEPEEILTNSEFSPSKTHPI